MMNASHCTIWLALSIPSYFISLHSVNVVRPLMLFQFFLLITFIQEDAINHRVESIAEEQKIGG